MISRDSLNLQLVKSMSMNGMHSMAWFDKKLGIECERHTPVKSDGFSFGKTIQSWFIAGCEVEFKSVDDLIDFYNEKWEFEKENPGTELKLVKVYVKKPTSPTGE